ncbi:MAG: hypothetical protein AAF226_16870, partial [Verrucomicrobiota bacterium]
RRLNGQRFFACSGDAIGRTMRLIITMAAESDSSKIIIPGDTALPTETTAETIFDALLRHFSDGQAQAGDLDPKLVKKLREELDRGGFFSQDMHSLWLMLEQAMTKTDRHPGKSGRVNLLNLACGYCEEGAVLSAFFGRHGMQVKQFAMDLRDHEIDRARRRYSATETLFRSAGIPGIKTEDETNEVEFVADDATHLAGYGQIPVEFDVVFIRHQNLWHDKAVWQRIYEFALGRIEPNQGCLVITSYFDREHVLALELLRNLGGQNTLQ